MQILEDVRSTVSNLLNTPSTIQNDLPSTSGGFLPFGQSIRDAILDEDRNLKGYDMYVLLYEIYSVYMYA